MKRNAALLRGVCFFFVVIVGGIALFGTDQQLISDPNLELAVREAIGKPTGPLVEADLVGLTELDAAGLKIANIDGIEHCVNLESLDLGNRWIGGKYLHNDIVDISPLAELTNLEWLRLDGNQIADIGPLGQLTGLVTLRLSNNKISEIEDISPLQNLTNLESLTISRTSIRDIAPLAELTNLTSLDLQMNKIEDISPLASLNNVEWLGLSYNAIRDISPLEGMTRLTHLYLQGNGIEDISPLEGMTRLLDLYLWSNKIADISPLEGMTELWYLSLDDNKVSDIGPLEGLMKLTNLYLGSNEIVDIKSLAGLISLNDLSLRYNGIVDISPLAMNQGLGEGDEISLEGNVLDTQPGSADMDVINRLTQRGVEVAYDVANFPDDEETSVILHIADPELEMFLRDYVGSRDPSGYERALALDDLDFEYEISWTESPIRLATATKEGVYVNITSLVLIDHQCNNLAALVNVPSLRSVSLNRVCWESSIDGCLDRRSGVTPDLESLRQLSQVTKLTLFDINVEDWSILEGMEALQELFLSDYNAVDLDFVKFAPGLRELALWGQSSETSFDLEPLSQLTSLTFLLIERQPVRNTEALRSLQQLDTLRLWNVSIDQIDGLGDLQHLTDLDLRGNAIRDIGPIAGLRELKRLDLSDNSIIDIRALSDLTELTEISLNGNEVDDISGLVSNMGIGADDILDLRYNGLSVQPGSPHMLDIDTLQARGVDVAYGSIVKFPDSNFERAIRAAINKPHGAISDVDLKDLVTLNAAYGGISDLTGIEYCISLEELNLARNAIEDIGLLKELNNLVNLRLGWNQIQDISSLSSLASLKELVLWGNPVAEIGPLSNLGSLESLNLLETCISDVSPLSSLLGLTDLALSSDELLNLAPLSTLQSLTSLGLAGGNLEDLAPLADLTALATLSIESSQILDVSALSKLANLTGLSLRAAGIRSLAPLSELVALTQLNLEGSNIDDISALAGLVNLVRLDLSENQLTGIDALSGMTSLETLSIWGNEITDMSGLEGVTNLEYLYAGMNRIADLTPLANHGRLISVYLYRNSITSIPKLAGLDELVGLDLSNNRIVDISAQTGMPKLLLLDLSENQIRDLSGLSSLRALRSLDLTGNYISTLDALTELVDLESVELDFNQIDDITPLVTNLGIGEGDDVSLNYNYLSIDTNAAHRKCVSILEERGASISTWSEVAFQDEQLDAVIRGAIEKPEGSIHYVDLAELTTLDAANQGINSLGGISFCRNLEKLVLSGNGLSDLWFLGALARLTELDLSDNQIIDISPLGSAVGLVDLSLNANEITSPDALGQLPNLVSLDLANNNIRDIGQLAESESIEQLNLIGNPLDNVSAVQSLASLQYARFDGNLSPWDTTYPLPASAVARLGGGRILDAKYSPDGSVVAVATSLGLELRSSRSLELVRVVTQDLSYVTSLMFSPDGTLLAMSSRGAPCISMLDAATGEETGTFIGSAGDDWLCCPEFNADGSMLLAIQADGGVSIWSVETAELLTTIPARQSEYGSLETRDAIFSPDGQAVVMVHVDGVITAWSIDQEQRLQLLQNDRGISSSISFSPDGRLLSWGSYDNTVRICDAVSGEVVHILEGHQMWAYETLFSPDGRALATASVDGEIKLWNVSDGTLTRSLVGHGDAVVGLSYSSDGSELVSASIDGSIRVWDTELGVVRSAHDNAPCMSGEIGFFNDGASVVAHVTDGTVVNADFMGGEGMWLSPPQGGSYNAPIATNSSNGRKIAVGLDNGHIWQWNLDLGTTLSIETAEIDAVGSIRGMMYSPSGDILVTTAYDNIVRLWDSRTGDPLHGPLEHTDSVISGSMRDDGQVLLILSRDGQLSYWNPLSGELYARVGPYSPIDPEFGMISPIIGGEFVVFINAAGYVSVWDTEYQVLSHMLRIQCMNERAEPSFFAPIHTYPLAISAEQRLLVMGTTSGAVKIYNLLTGELLESFLGHTVSVASAVFSSDGLHLATSSGGYGDGTVMVWDLSDLRN